MGIKQNWLFSRKTDHHGKHTEQPCKRKFLLTPRTIRLGQINMGAITYYLGEKNKLKTQCTAVYHVINCCALCLS